MLSHTNRTARTVCIIFIAAYKAASIHSILSFFILILTSFYQLTVGVKGNNNNNNYYYYYYYYYY